MNNIFQNIYTNCTLKQNSEELLQSVFLKNKNSEECKNYKYYQIYKILT